MASYIILDVGHVWQLSYQDPASHSMLNLISLNYYIYIYLMIILITVTFLLKEITTIFYFKNELGECQFNHAGVLEIVWTLLPSVVLIFIAIPSFSLLYQMEKFGLPLQTIKVIGHQWYWSYEYSDYAAIEFTSYCKPFQELSSGDFRLLEVDNPLVLPIKRQIRFIITSSDVIHSWAIPSLAVKVDAVPGRLNQYCFSILKEGTYYGQCSEICGVEHGFMPIKIIAVDYYNFTRVLAYYYKLIS